MTTRFSIVTVNWNNLAGLQETYRSLAEQRFQQFRWIVIDGASTDGSAQWLQSLDCRQLETISERDRGIYDAMAKGQAQAVATPGYTLFLGSGDTLAGPAVLERVAQAIEDADTPPALVYGDAYRRHQDGGVALTPARPLEWLPLGVPAALQSTFFENGRLSTLRFRPRYKLSANYCLLIEYLNDINDRTKVVRLRSGLSVVNMEGVSQRRRLDAIKEDVHIRMCYLAIPWPRAFALYLLHYLHAQAKSLGASLGLAPSGIDRMLSCRVALRRQAEREGP